MIHGGHRVQNEICVIGLKSAEKNKTTTYSDRNPQPATRNSSNTFALNPRKLGSDLRKGHSALSAVKIGICGESHPRNPATFATASSVDRKRMPSSFSALDPS